mgnify:CR=1 FL=1
MLFCLAIENGESGEISEEEKLSFITDCQRIMSIIFNSISFKFLKVLTDPTTKNDKLEKKILEYSPRIYIQFSLFGLFKNTYIQEFLNWQINIPIKLF